MSTTAKKTTAKKVAKKEATVWRWRTTPKKTATKKTVTKKTNTNKKVKSEELITIIGEINNQTGIFNLSNSSIEFLTENKTIAKEISKIIDNILNDKEKEEETKKLNIEKLNPIIKQCENKINEIKEIIKDFDYSDKKTYEEATTKIEKDLEELENKDISVSRVNEIIDEINETYRNAYKKKNNVSALSYIMETDEDIDLIKKIDIDNL